MIFLLSGSWEEARFLNQLPANWGLLVEGEEKQTLQAPILQTFTGDLYDALFKDLKSSRRCKDLLGQI